MKFLKYLLGILLLLIIIFFAVGLAVPEFTYEEQITIDKPVEEVWNVMSDESKLPEWLSGFQKTELVSGEPGTVGSVSNVYFIQDGREEVIEETITQVEPNELMAMDFKTEFMNMEYQMRFDGQGDQTVVTSKTKNMGNGMFAKSLLFFMKGAMKKQETDNMQKLKKVVETNTKTYATSSVSED